jgi:hypothetical protein
MKTFYPEPEKPKKKTATSKMAWDDLVEAFTRAGNDRALKEELHLEMRRRVRLGWQGNERYAPLRLFHH